MLDAMHGELCRFTARVPPLRQCHKPFHCTRLELYIANLPLRTLPRRDLAGFGPTIAERRHR